MTAIVGDLDGLFGALANASRREIVTYLAAGPAATPEIGRQFPLSKQALNRHIITLEEAGLIRRTLKGRVHQIELNIHSLDGLTGWAQTIYDDWAANLDRLADIVEPGNCDE